MLYTVSRDLFQTQNGISNPEWYFKPRMVFQTQNGISNPEWYFKLRMVFQTQNGISNRMVSPTPHHFWSSVKKLRKKATSIPPLFDNNSPVHSDLPKANLLNHFFSTCFNSSTPPLTRTSHSDSPPSTSCPLDLLCSEDELLHLLLNLSSDTASRKTT